MSRRCPLCSDNTTNKRTERCPSCHVTITRNARGEAETARRGSRVLFKRRPNWAPDDTTRAAQIHMKSNRAAVVGELDPTELPADHGNNTTGRLQFGRRDKETTT